MTTKCQIYNLFSKICRIRRELESLRTKLSRAEEQSDGLWIALVEIERSLEPHSTMTCRSDTSAIPDRAAEQVLRRLAQSGLKELTLVFKPNHSASVQADGGETFTLPPRLAQLLECLAQDNPGSEDDLVPWKSVFEIAAWLEKRTGKTATPHAIHNLVCRLRRAFLTLANLSPYLIQSDPRRGVRLALRHKLLCLPGPVACSPQEPAFLTEKCSPVQHTPSLAARPGG